MESKSLNSIIDAFSNANDPLYQQLYPNINASHWSHMLGNKSAVECKCGRSQYIFDKLNLANKRVLDYGSGMGFLSNFIGLAGADSVVGVEVLQESRETSTFLKHNIFKLSNVEFIETLEQSPVEQFDAILLCNVISHVQKPIQTIISLLDRLQPGGLIFIEDNNNFQSPLVRRRNRRTVWPLAEMKYSKRRQARIQDKSTNDFVSGDYLEQVRGTYGMTYMEIDRFLQSDGKSYLNSSEIEYMQSKAPIDPDTNIYHENSFSPTEIECILFNIGMAIREKSAKHVFDFRRHALVSFCFRLFPQFSLNISPAYEIVAIKR